MAKDSIIIHPSAKRSGRSFLMNVGPLHHPPRPYPLLPSILSSRVSFPSKRSIALGAILSIAFIPIIISLEPAMVRLNRFLSAQAAASSMAFFTPLLATGDNGSIDTNWYPPAQTEINNLDDVLSGNGIYGWIYDSSYTPKKEYGLYNWCNMPHVRRDTYQKADEEYELVYVELIHRHHKRTPYSSNSFPVESYHWDCDDSYLHFYGEPATEQPPAARVYRQGYISEVNPFVPSGWIGSCQFPQITKGGLDDSWTHGGDLWEVYGDMLGFLPRREADWTESVRYRVTNNLITSQVAGMVVEGMWETREAYPLLTQADGIDSLEPQYSCPAGSNAFNTIQSSSNPQWQQHLERASSLYAELDNISGVPSDDQGFHMSFDHYYDNLSARQCHNKPLPCKLVNGTNSTTCVTQSLADSVYRLGHWEYSQVYRDNEQSLAASVATFGVWVGELTTHLRDAMGGASQVRYFHNVAHDGSVSRLLSILQIDEMVWPGMGSEVVFELYKKSGRPQHGGDASSSQPKYYVRVLFGGKILKSSNPTLGTMDMVPVSQVLGYLEGLVGQGASQVESKCNA